MSTVSTALKRWELFCDDNGWDPLLPNDAPYRGGRLAAWVISMLDDTELVYKSIANYVWGVCTWHTLQHKLDPTLGIQDWKDLMSAVAVLSAVPGEPRKSIPLDTVRLILEHCGTAEVEDAQFGLMVLLLLFTFTRTEVPCPKNFTGPQSFDPLQHWQVQDFKLRVGSPVGQPIQWVLWVRFKAYKQDPRMERPSASHAPPFVDFDATAPKESKDWVPIGDIPGSPLFSIATWYQNFVRLMGRSRDPEEPMFVARDLV